MLPTGDAFRILQLHPTLRCNLRCLHCYSNSSPEQAGALQVPTLLRAVEHAAEEQYNVLSISGGEPLLYEGLADVLDGAHRAGMLTMLATNGMLLDARRVSLLAGRADLIAVSVDGVPDSHNRIRGSGRAFGLMAQRLEHLRRAEIPFGFIFTLTGRNAHELEWVAAFAAEQGARLLQVHPLEETGRAATEMRGLEPDDFEMTALWLESKRIQAKYRDQLQVQADLIDWDGLRAHPDSCFRGAVREAWSTTPLGRLLSPLVVEADGSVVPLTYGFARGYGLGNILESTLRDLATSWRERHYLRFAALCRRAWDGLAEADPLPFVNWYRVVALAAAAEDAPAQGTALATLAPVSVVSSQSTASCSSFDSRPVAPT